MKNNHLLVSIYHVSADTMNLSHIAFVVVIYLIVYTRCTITFPRFTIVYHRHIAVHELLHNY